jgi:hypothetical protein
MQQLDPNLIPGMIEPVERQLLRKLARDLSFADGDCAVEFGAFFGKSTSFIAEGLAEQRSHVPKLYVYDSFGCDQLGSFQPVVIGFAESGGVLNLLREDSGRLDFFPIFCFYLKEKIDSGAVVPITAELANSIPPSDSVISLMHIDSPKMYVDFKPILFRFFPRLRVGGVIVFQDFFYHWSATLIAVVGALARAGIIEFQESAASSLVCVLRKAIDARMSAEIDLELSSDERIIPLVDYATAECRKLIMDRPETFLPRLQLAKVQWLMERGEGDKAAGVVRQFFQDGGMLNQAVLVDFIELMSHSFSIDRLYRLDHQARSR